MADHQATLEEGLKLFESGNEQDRYKGKRRLQDALAAVGSPGQDEARQKAARTLAEALINGGKYAIEARSEIARQLAEVGGDSEVVALESAMTDLQLREPARFALDRIPTPAATAALVRAAKNAVGSRFLVGVMHALGQRTGDGVYEALVEGTKDANGDVRVAAAEALAQHADPAGDQHINDVAADGLTAIQQKQLAKARVRLAGTLMHASKLAEAKTVFASILSSNPPEPQANACRRALERIG